jgi:hypothetical protein
MGLTCQGRADEQVPRTGKVTWIEDYAHALSQRTHFKNLNDVENGGKLVAKELVKYGAVWYCSLTADRFSGRGILIYYLIVRNNILNCMTIPETAELEFIQGPLLISDLQVMKQNPEASRQLSFVGSKYSPFSF